MAISTARGVALITALLVVALTTVLAVAMMTQQQLSIRRTMNLINRDQAYCYALGAEQWSQQLLLRDDPEIDSFHEHWATPLPPLPIPGGSLQGQLEDLQARFNLNNLIRSTPESLTAELKFFERLLSVLELPTSLAQVVLDWLDEDIIPQMPHGAEDDRYLIKTPAYRAANSLFKSPSEIRLLAGIDVEEYEKLIPYISTLPTPTAININTAPLPILMALTDNLDEVQGQHLINDRTQQPFASVKAFIEASGELKTAETPQLSVNSGYFLLTTQVQIDSGHAYLNSVLYRQASTIQVLRRSRDHYSILR